MRFDVEPTPSCLFDRVEVYDGTQIRAPMLKKLCGSKRPDVITSSGNSLLVKFVTDKTKTMNGFYIKYTSIKSAQGKT